MAKRHNCQIHASPARGRTGREGSVLQKQQTLSESQGGDPVRRRRWNPTSKAGYSRDSAARSKRMHLFKEQAVQDFAAAAKAIPVIDYGPYFAGEPGALGRLAAEVADACENIGFFYALNHGVPDDLVERAFVASRRFFALPQEQKLALKLNQNNIGYLPINASVQGASTVHRATRPNLNESFFISHDRGPDHPEVVAGRPLRGRNQWPAAQPEIRASMMAYFSALGAMCDRMLPPFAVALGMPPNAFASFFAGEAHANLRFLHYPPQETVEDNTFGQAPHTDNSFMTALARTEVPGLAVRLPSGEWFPPPIIPGTFLINLGNIMRRWSNDRFLSTPHGVINESGTDRYSIAYFHSPNPDSVIGCLPSCVSAGNPARYPPTLYRDLVLEFYRANYFHQKGHRSEAAALAAAE
jgi:isopenicillin N synthase-like dioxygenase